MRAVWTDQCPDDCVCTTICLSKSCMCPYGGKPTPSNAEQLEFDRLVYGTNFTDMKGKRINPLRVSGVIPRVCLGENVSVFRPRDALWEPMPDYIDPKIPDDVEGFWLCGFTFWASVGGLSVIHDASGDGVVLSPDMVRDLLTCHRDLL